MSKIVSTVQSISVILLLDGIFWKFVETRQKKMPSEEATA